MKRVKRVEHLYIRAIRAQGIVGAGAIIRTFTVWFPLAVWLRTTYVGLTRDNNSSYRSMFSEKCFEASSWMA
jgi:hypothetical protein